MRKRRSELNAVSHWQESLGSYIFPFHPVTYASSRSIDLSLVPCQRLTPFCQIALSFILDYRQCNTVALAREIHSWYSSLPKVSFQLTVSC